MANKKYLEDCGGLKPHVLPKPKTTDKPKTTSKPKTTKKPKRK